MVSKQDEIQKRSIRSVSLHQSNTLKLCLLLLNWIEDVTSKVKNSNYVSGKMFSLNTAHLIVSEKRTDLRIVESKEYIVKNKEMFCTIF